MPTEGHAGEEKLPTPPADLDERELPIRESGGPWVRMHPVEYHPVYFGKGSRSRFDDPEGEYGVLYAADDEFGAFVESFGRQPGRNLVSVEKLRARPLAALEVEEPLRLVDLTGPGLARIGATGTISTDHYQRAQRWSHALHDHPGSPDGMCYRLKHDLSRVGVALFDRVGAEAIRARPVGTLIAPEREKLLAAILGEYGFGLIDGPLSS